MLNAHFFYITLKEVEDGKKIVRADLHASSNTLRPGDGGGVYGVCIENVLICGCLCELLVLNCTFAT